MLSLSQKLVSALAILATILVLLPLYPKMPLMSLDPSWAYALNVAVSRHLVFGRDLIFTFGPLGSVYTRMYSPDTDHLMMMASTVTACGICAGFLLATSRRRWLLVFLPLIVILVQSYDAIFMSPPLCLLLAALMISGSGGESPRVPASRSAIVLLTVLACSIGFLPLIKGSFSGVVGLLGFLSIVILWRSKHTLLAAYIVILAGASLCIGWLLAGQSFFALPGFFIAQKPIISGYSSAMSYHGPFISVGFWFIGAVSCVVAFYFCVARQYRINGLLATVGVIAYLFITFKAGFVRQDVHPRTAIGSVLLCCLVFTTFLRPRIALLLGCLVLFSWLNAERQIQDFGSRDVVSLVSDAASRVASGINARADGHVLPNMFSKAKRSIRVSSPLPQVTGSVDVYPTELAVVFANDLQWAGRPILQSYSAYTPELDRINALHLLGKDAPQNVFFAVDPIDGHLPSLEDASSWPILLSNYNVVGKTKNFVQLARSGLSRLPVRVPLVEGEAKINQPIAIPAGSGIVLASIDLQETLLGKLAMTMFKLPQVTIESTLKDGKVVQNRFIPGMARNGFIASPYIDSNRDFISVAAGFGSRDVQQIKIIVPDIGLWKKAIRFSLSKVQIEAQPAAANMVAFGPTNPPAYVSEVPVVPGAKCSLDVVDDAAAAGHKGSFVSDYGLLHLAGWASPDPLNGISPDETWFIFKATDGTERFFKSPIVPRPDVAAVFRHPEMTAVGFDADLNIKTLSGPQELTIRTFHHNKAQDCGIKISVVARKS